MTKITAYRYHDISCGHRVVGHEGKCVHPHGHNYRVHFYCEAAELDSLGRVIDFSVIKARLCEWLEVHWDHKMILWEDDPTALWLIRQFPEGITTVPFNPTAENMARFLLEQLGPAVLADLPITLTKVVVDETRKCSAIAELE